MTTVRARSRGSMCPACRLLLVVAMSASLVASADAAQFWLSSAGSVAAGSAPPATPSQVASVTRSVAATTGSLYLWGRPDPGKTLTNWSFNVESTNPSVATFVDAQIDPYNPTLGMLPPPNSGPIQRWEWTYVPTGSSSFGGSDPNNHIQAFSIQDGTGIGAAVASIDPFYDAIHDGWLMARLDYQLHATVGQTDFFLQIGARGLSHAGEPTANSNVGLGALSDLTLNADTQRLISSGTADATLIVSTSLPANADFDGNGRVGGNDLLIWQRGLGTSSGATQSQGDANGDQAIDAADFSVWQQQFGTQPPVLMAVAIPEPATSLLTLAGLAMVLLHRKRLRAHSRSR